MNRLFLDIASHAGLVALVSDDAVIAAESIDHRISDAELIPVLEKVLAHAKWTPQDLTHIACIIGPGGFTSLRVACALANTFADQLDIPSCGIHLSNLYRSRIISRSEGSVSLAEVTEPPLRGKSVTGSRDSQLRSEGNVIWLHSTKKSALFVRGFGSFAAQWPEPVLVSLDDLLAALPKDAVITGELIPEHQQVIKRGHVLLGPINDVFPAFLSSQTYGKQILLPWYGRGW